MTKDLVMDIDTILESLYKGIPVNALCVTMPMQREFWLFEFQRLSGPKTTSGVHRSIL